MVIADTLRFVNILVSGIFHGRFAQRLAVNKQMPDKTLVEEEERGEAKNINFMPISWQ